MMTKQCHHGQMGVACNHKQLYLRGNRWCPAGYRERTLATMGSVPLVEVGEWRALAVSLEAPASDVNALSCPPLSIHLHHSHPTAFLCHQFPSALLPLSINLSPPSVSSPLSVCLFHPLILSFLSESLLLLLLPSFFAPLYNFAPYVSIPLVLCHSLWVPHLFSTLL